MDVKHLEEVVAEFTVLLEQERFPDMERFLAPYAERGEEFQDALYQRLELVWLLRHGGIMKGPARKISLTDVRSNKGETLGKMLSVLSEDLLAQKQELGFEVNEPSVRPKKR